MAVPAKTLLATGAAFAVGVGLTVSLLQPTSKADPATKPASQKTATADQGPAPKAVAPSATPGRAWVDPVRSTPPASVASVPPVEGNAESPSADPAPRQVAEAPATPRPIATPRKRVAAPKAAPTRSVTAAATARPARSRVARVRQPRDDYAVASQGPVSESTFVRREEAPYDPYYRTASSPARGYLYADAGASDPYADQRIEPRASGRSQGGVIRWLKEPGTH